MSLPPLPDVPRDNRRTATVVAVAVLGVLCVGGLVFGLKGLFAPADGQPGGAATTAAGPRPSTDSAAPTTEGGDVSTPSSAGPAAASTPPEPAGDLVQFSSPSGNIRCALSSAGARCDIGDKTWAPGARPGDCQADWGTGLFVDGARASVTCASDAVDGGSALKYGKAVTRGDFTCRSSKDGISCRDGSSGHAFSLSRAAFQVS
ncbi:DUF6636 domain-containing protein [Angustibacter luteus]|uniref:DUF6636 domain-containing protein n=1 Tax=Angustibacter luteus TaxID=658456 RepID=A0ABW1JJW5_9ACTN